MILVDTDVLIAHLRGHAAADGWLHAARTQGGLAASAVTVTELLGGMRSPERHAVTRLLATLSVQPVTIPIARQAGTLMQRFRASHSGIGLGDYLIAATSLEMGLALATLNVRHFPMFDDLEPPFHP